MVKFDVVIGNPPYQISDGAGGQGSSSKPVYNKFIESGIGIGADIVTMITPSRWFVGGKGLDGFRKYMLSLDNIKYIEDYPDSGECFQNVSIKGGVSFLIYDRNHEGDTKINTNYKGKSNSMIRPLVEKDLDFFIRQNDAVSIVRKVIPIDGEPFSSIISSRKPFGISSTFKDYDTIENETSVVIYGNSIKSYTDISNVTKNHNDIDKYKVFISFAYGAGDTIPHQIINKPFLGEKGSISTETYLSIGPFETENESLSCIKYIKSRFFRFLVSQKKISQNATKKVYDLVPLQDFTKDSDIDWSKSIAEIDQQLYKKYGLNEEEIEFIETHVKEME